MGTPAVSLPPSALDTPAGELPLAVWSCAQTSAQYQRAGRYLPASTAHPAKMLPELARRIIAEYSPASGLVVDPMCGIGTTLVEAAALGRRAVGVELEPRWAELARANLAFALADQQARGDTAGAREAIDQAERAFASPEIVALHNPVPAERARLLLARGEVAEAAQWVQERGLADGDAPSYPREREFLVLARVLLARNAPDRALDLLGRLRALAEADRRTGSVIALGALRALAFRQAGNLDLALAALVEVLALSYPEGYVRIYADEGPPMAALLQRLVAAGERGRSAAGGEIPVDYLGRLLRAFQQDRQGRARHPGREASLGMPGRGGVLTGRELEVLGLLEAGKQNREIAEELMVTPATVKKHVTHILDKLGAANRTQAVAHARALALIR